MSLLLPDDSGTWYTHLPSPKHIGDTRKRISCACGLLFFDFGCPQGWRMPWVTLGRFCAHQKFFPGFFGIFFGPGRVGSRWPHPWSPTKWLYGTSNKFSRAQNCPFMYYFRGSDGTFGPKMVEESARNVLVLVQKLKLDALLWICLLCGLVAGACNVCWAPGARKRHGIAISGSKLVFVLCLWPALPFLKSCTKCARYHSNIEIGCSPLNMIILWAGGLGGAGGVVLVLCSACLCSVLLKPGLKQHFLQHLALKKSE
jgi:hypothetical protein